MNVDEVVEAAREYAKITKRRVSIELILINDILIKPAVPTCWPRVLRRGNWGWVHVNLIP